MGSKVVVKAVTDGRLEGQEEEAGGGLLGWRVFPVPKRGALGMQGPE